MARYDVYADGEVFLLDCQSDVLSHLESRFVVPLVPKEATPPITPRLNPVFRIKDVEVVMATQLASAVPVRHLRERVASLEAQHFTIMNAFDVLLTGV